MRKKSLILLFLVANYCFSQSVNDYKAVIIPLKYDFLKEENQYRLQTFTKINLKDAGFQSFYSNESIPAEYNDRCSLLYVDVKKENGFLVTKLFVIFKDCYNKIIFQSPIGKSREKEFESAYIGALNEAFEAVNALGYKYNGGENNNSKIAVISQPITPSVAVSTSKNEVIEPKIVENRIEGLLYAQPTAYGYQLIDSEPKVIMKVYKTSNPSSYMAAKGNVQGVLVSKDNQWFFEYYQNDQLVSEKINVKF